MPRQITCVAIFVLFFIFFGCQSSIADEINLDDLSSPIHISDSVNTVELTRGKCTYVLTKKAVLDNKKYIVFMADTLTFGSGVVGPEDAYSKTLDIVPADDEAAVRAMEIAKKGGADVKDMSEAQQMMDDMNHFNAVKFIVAILPADEHIRDISKQINEGDVIDVSGIHFKYSKVIFDGKEEPNLSHCMVNTDVLYVRSLDIHRTELSKLSRTPKKKKEKMIDVLIPLIAGILLLVKPDMFLKKDLDEEAAEKKRGFFAKIGWVLIGASILIFLSKILIVLSGL